LTIKAQHTEHTLLIFSWCIATTLVVHLTVTGTLKVVKVALVL